MLLRVLSGAFALVVTLGASAPLSEYVWCPGSGETHISCCCPSVPRDTDRLRKPCCEARETLSLEASQAHASAPRVLAPAPAPVLALVVVLAPATPVVATADRGDARAGPSLRVHALHSLYLL